MNAINCGRAWLADESQALPSVSSTIVDKPRLLLTVAMRYEPDGPARFAAFAPLID